MQEIGKRLRDDQWEKLPALCQIARASVAPVLRPATNGRAALPWIEAHAVTPGHGCARHRAQPRPMERAPAQTSMPGAQGRRLAKCSNTLAGFNGMVLLARFHVRHAPLKPPLKHALGAIQAVPPPAVDRADGLPGVHGPKYQYHSSPCSGSKRSSTHPAQRRASAHDVLLRRFLPIRLQRGAPVLQKTGYTAGRKFLGDAALAKRLTAWRNGTETP